MQLVNVSRLGGIYSLLNRNSIQLWNSLCVAGHEGLGGGIQMIPLAELQGREMPPCTGDAALTSQCSLIIISHSNQLKSYRHPVNVHQRCTQALQKSKIGQFHSQGADGGGIGA